MVTCLATLIVSIISCFHDHYTQSHSCNCSLLCINFVAILSLHHMANLHHIQVHCTHMLVFIHLPYYYTDLYLKFDCSLNVVRSSYFMILTCFYCLTFKLISFVFVHLMINFLFVDLINTFCFCFYPRIYHFIDK